MIEDQSDLCELIVYNLAKQKIYGVESVDNANDALIMLDNSVIDLILLDLMLPGLSGLDFLKIIKAKDESKNIPVIIISAKTKEQDVITGLKLGADDYLSKPFSLKILLARIEAVLRRSKPETQAKLHCGTLSINPDNFKVYASGQEIRLTSKEFELLQLFMKNPGKAFRREQLLNSIWGYESDLYTRTVDAHISSLRKKLGTEGKLIKSFPKIGYGLDL